MFDVIIIGGGPAGLYTAYQLQKFTRQKILVLEKRPILGGRTNMIQLTPDLKATCGAGVVRDHDYLLIEVCTILGINLRFKRSVIKTPQGARIHGNRLIHLVDELRAKYEEVSRLHPNIRYDINFETFCHQYMPRGFLERFIKYAGYTDYLKADVKDTIESYMFTDNTDFAFTSKIDWDEMITKLASLLESNGVNIQTQKHVVNITRKKTFVVKTVDGSIFYGKKIVIATTVLDYAIFPNARLMELSQNIRPQPFLRLYAEFANPLESFVTTGPVMIYTNDVYEKMYPVSLKKNMYCISYSDNDNAMVVVSKPKSEIERDMKNEVRKLWKCFHHVGTHCFKPLMDEFSLREQFVDAIQNPDPDVFIVGEAVSLSQGWTEGALESVTRVMPRLVL